MRDATELRALQLEAGKQKEELEIIDQILTLSQSKFLEFIKSAKDFIEENRQLIKDTQEKDLNVIATLFVMYKDDGKGLGLDHSYKKALGNNIFNSDQSVTDEEIAELIFHSGLSTAENVTTVSGRGVGMDAIRRFIQRLGGDIRLEFTAAKGKNGYRPFTQIITIPEKYCVRL